MSLARLWAVVRAAWLQILLMTLVAGGVAFALASGLPKVYTAKARVMLNIANSDPAQFSEMRSDMAASYIDTEMRLVTDDAVMRAVVKQLGWPDNAQVIAAWQDDRDNVDDVTTWAAHRLAQNVSVRPLEDSAIIEIYYSTSSLDAAKLIAGMIRSTFIEQRQKLRAEAARHGSDWNRTQAARALATLQAAEAQRAAFATANRLVVDTPAGGLDYAAQATALAQSASPLDAATTRVAPDQTSDLLTRRLHALEAQIAVLRLSGDQQNPQIVMLTAQRDAVAGQLAHEQAAAAAGPNATSGQIGIVRAERDAAYLQARLALLDRAPLYDKLAMMDRDIAFKAALYQNAAARVANLASVAAAPSGANVLGDIIADADPTFPDIPLMVGIAVAATLALGVVIAILGELGRHQVGGSEEMAFAVGAPVLAVIERDARPGWRQRLVQRLGRMLPRRRRAAASGRSARPATV